MRKTGIVALTLLLSSTQALAWNGAGHRLVALVAYERLDADTRERVVALLKKHPRFNQDFTNKMPQKVKDHERDEVRAQWLFGQAAVWPDIARGFRGADEKYHHSTWHYINEPLFLSDADEEALGDDIPANLKKEWTPGMQLDKLNIIQALKRAMNHLETATVSKADKAVLLCWIFHLVGDLHQPLHSMALFSKKRFAKGDRGGNLILVKEKRNLHSFWDGTLGRSSDLFVLSLKTRKFLDDSSLKKAGEKAATTTKFEDWLVESYNAALEFAYDEPILEAVADKEGVAGDLDPVELTEDYIEAAKEVSTERVVQAGYRLGKVMEKLFPAP